MDSYPGCTKKQPEAPYLLFCALLKTWFADLHPKKLFANGTLSCRSFKKNDNIFFFFFFFFFFFHGSGKIFFFFFFFEKKNPLLPKKKKKKDFWEKKKKRKDLKILEKSWKNPGKIHEIS